MNDEHKHVWSVNGCYCGARRCEHAETSQHVLREASEQRKTIRRVRVHGQMRYAVLCENAAITKSSFCQEHQR